MDVNTVGLTFVHDFLYSVGFLFFDIASAAEPIYSARAILLVTILAEEFLDISFIENPCDVL